MFDALARAIEELEVPGDGASLAALVALRDRLDAYVAAGIAAFDAAEGWAAQGEGSVAGWLKSHCSMGTRSAAASARRASVVAALPVTAAAWRGGELSSGQVDAVVGQLDERNLEKFVADERSVVPKLAGLSVRQTMAEMVEWRRAVTSADDEKDAPEPVGSVSIVRREGGRSDVRADLDPEVTQLFENALRVAMRKDDEDEPERSWEQRRHDAVGDVCKFFLDNQTARGGGSHRPHISVVVTRDDLLAGKGGLYSDGSFVDPITMSTMTCDCIAHRVTLDISSVQIDMGRETRSISPRQRTGLIVLDGGCRWRGCDRPAVYCDGHHVQWWEHGGPTDLSNLVLLCRHHHRILHKPGWSAELAPDRTFRVTDPNGHAWTTAPPGLVRLRPTG